MTTKTAAEQVAEALEQLTDAAIAATHGVIDQHIVAAIQNAHAALERWRAEQDSADSELQAVRQQRDALVVAAKAMIADLDMRARMHGDVEDGIAVLDVSSSVLERTYLAIEAASKGEQP